MQQVRQQAAKLIQWGEKDELEQEEEEIDRLSESESTQSAREGTGRRLPVIEVGEVGWAEEYLSTITLQNFKQVEAVRQLHGANMATLNNTLVRYQHRLSQLEGELRESYRQKKASQRRSNRVLQ